MNIDIYIIVLTAFAVFGIYSFIEIIVTLYDSCNSPASVVIMRYSDREKTCSKIHYIDNAVYNNRIILVTDEDIQHNIYPGCTVCRECEISRAVAQRLFTKNAD